jgi:hypothetical protein
MARSYSSSRGRCRAQCEHGASAVWFLAVWLPANEMIIDGRDLFVAMFGGFVLDLVVTPWP